MLSPAFVNWWVCSSSTALRVTLNAVRSAQRHLLSRRFFSENFSATVFLGRLFCDSSSAVHCDQMTSSCPSDLWLHQVTPSCHLPRGTRWHDPLSVIPTHQFWCDASALRPCLWRRYGEGRCPELVAKECIPSLSQELVLVLREY